MGPIFYQQSATGSKFDAIKSMEPVDINLQRCPALEEGQFVLIRGFDENYGKVSPYCVKVLVEEISLASTVLEKE